MDLVLDRFQRMKHRRMKILLAMIERKGQMSITKFLGYVAVRYGIRRATAMEYLDDWSDVGCISVDNGIIKFVKKPTDEESAQ
jgi:hypothetical protein